jgi:starch synthase
LRVAFVAPEVVPFSKTGGLADVAGALPAALREAGAEVVTVSPLYRCVRRHALEDTGRRVRVPVGDAVIESSVFRSGGHCFLEHDPYFDRDGLYGAEPGDYEDNARRFIFLCRGALEWLKGQEPPDVVHAHDWQAGLVPVYLKTLYQEAFPRARSVFTIHNIAYQGNFWHWDMPLTGLDWKHFNWREMEFHGRISLLKGGIVFADAVTTVSPTYAREILTPAFGCGLEGVVRDRATALHGILNGVDVSEWDPRTDPHLPARYGPEDPAGKAACKAGLQRECGLPVDPRVPLVGMIGRLVWQKGVDLFLESAEALARRRAQFVILGSGGAHYEEALAALARRHPRRFAVRAAFDDALAHRIEAGSDLFLMPSRYEPCGLNQIYSLRYGTVPVVHATGGLADTVEEGVTGFTFSPFTREALLGAMGRALEAFGERARWRAMMLEGMRREAGWSVPARRYLELYRSLVPGK